MPKKIGGYWEDKKTRNLFAPNGPIEETDVALSLHISLLDDLMNHPQQMNIHVNKADECGLGTMDMAILQKKCLYLRQAYQYALELLPGPGVTWKDCCQKSIDFLNEIGVSTIKYHETLITFHFATKNNFLTQIFPLNMIMNTHPQSLMIFRK